MSFLILDKQRRFELVDVSVLRRKWEKQRRRFKKKKKLKLRKYLLKKYLKKYKSLSFLIFSRKYLKGIRKILRKEKQLDSVSIKKLEGGQELYLVNNIYLKKRFFIRMIAESLMIQEGPLTNYLLFRLSLILKKKYFFLEKRIYVRRIFFNVFGTIIFRKTLNNIFITIKKKGVNKLVKLSGGMSFIKSKGKKYLKFPFGIVLGNYLGWRYSDKVFIIKLKGRVRPILKGFFTTFFRAGCKVSFIYLIPMISYNGCRLKKRRRL